MGRWRYLFDCLRRLTCRIGLATHPIRSGPMSTTLSEGPLYCVRLLRRVFFEPSQYVLNLCDELARAFHDHVIGTGYFDQGGIDFPNFQRVI